MLASQSDSAVTGILMLLTYSLGMGVPFVLSAVLANRIKNTFDFLKRNTRIIEIISGSLLILIGILMMTGIWDRFITLLS
jgi:cytochrome c-type biogenesis protein